MRNFPGILFCIKLSSPGSSLLVPSLTSLCSLHGPPSQKGALLGIWRSLGALARATGPLLTAAGGGFFLFFIVQVV